MPDVLVVGALALELKHVPDAVVTGVGKVQAASVLTHALARATPDVVVNLGSCGALTTDYEIGQLVQVTSVVEHDAMSVEVVSRMAGLPYAKEINLGALRSSDFGEHVRCASGDSFVTGKAERHALVEAHGAAVADMELYAYARVCQAFRVPLVSLKIVSDVPGQTVSDWREHLDGVASFIGDIPWQEWLNDHSVR